MEHETLQRRSTATVKNMGVNSYSQIVSAFRAQGDLTDDQLSILPVLQNTLGVTRERHTAEIKRALFDEQLSEIATSINPSSDTTNWEVEADYNCPTIVHRPPYTNYVRLAEHVLQTTPPTTIIQHPQPIPTTKLNHDLQQLVRDEMRNDGIKNATQQHQLHTTIKPNFTNTEINSSKVVRLVRAKQATKRKSSLDTLIEVVQKELLRVNSQSSSISPSSSPPSHYSQTRSLPSSKLQTRISQSTLSPHRSIISSYPTSFMPQSNQTFKITRKRGMINLNNSKHFISLQQQRSIPLNNDDHGNHYMEHDNIEQSIDDFQSGPENIEEIVRDTVDKLVAITILNTAPFVVNMLTAIPRNGDSTNTETKVLTNNTTMMRSQSTIPKSDHYRNDLTLLSSTANDVRNSIQQISPLKQQQQQVHHPQLIIQPASTTSSLSTVQGTTTPTLFVAPRILNFQTVVPKPTTNIQIGNTKIILVSPSNITQHLPHSTTPMQPTSSTTVQQQQQGLGNNSPVKLVKFTTTNNNNTLTTRSTTLPMNSTQTSALTLPKNVQIVIPSQTPSTIQLTRTHNDDGNKSLSTTFRPVTTVPMTLTTCTVDQIPQAAQEITVTTSPTSSPPLPTNTSDLQQQSSLATITDNASSMSMIPQQQAVSNVTITRTSPTHDETLKSVAVNFQQQSQTIQKPSSTHGPMIYRMTSVNPNVPVFRVRAATTPTSTTVVNKSIKTDAKPISVATTNNMVYEPKPTHNTPTTSGSVSVLACFKTTKKRNKERAIMPRPSTTDTIDTSHELQQQRLNSTTNASTILSNDMINSNSSPDYRQQLSSTPTRLVQQNSLSSTLSDDNTSTLQEQTNDTTTSSSNSIPIGRNHNSNSLNILTTPNTSPPGSFIQSLHSTSRPLMRNQSIQCLDNDDNENSMETIDDGQTITNSETKKRSNDDEIWTVSANNVLRTILSQYDIPDTDGHESLSSNFALIQSNLLNGTITSKDEFYNSVLHIKEKLLDNTPLKTSEDILEKFFNQFEIEFSKLCDNTNERKRLRRESTED